MSDKDEFLAPMPMNDSIVEPEDDDFQDVEPSVTIPAFWAGVEEKWMKNVKAAHGMMSTKHGFYANIPIICRAHKCPYFEACYIPEDDLEFGTRCPIEVATILQLHERYCMQLEIDPNNVDPKKHSVDLSLINELVELQIKLMRTQKKLAMDADYVEQVVAGSTPDGQLFTRPELSQSELFAERLRKDIHKIMDDILGTRKSQKSTQGDNGDPSSKAANLMAQARKMMEASGADRGFVGIGFERDSDPQPKTKKAPMIDANFTDEED